MFSIILLTKSNGINVSRCLLPDHYIAKLCRNLDNLAKSYVAEKYMLLLQFSSNGLFACAFRKS